MSPVNLSSALRPQTLARTGPAPGNTVRQASSLAAVTSGLISELEPTRAVALANADMFAPAAKLHKEVIRNLPAGVQALVLIEAEFDEFIRPTLTNGLTQEELAKVAFVPVGLDSNWVRDYFPEAVRQEDGSLRLVDFKYGYQMSDSVGPQLAAKMRLPLTESPVVVEGGNLQVHRGTLYTTDHVYRANPDMPRDKVDAELKRALGIQKLKVLPALPREGTGHIDLFAKFVSDRDVVVASSAEPDRKQMLDGVAAELAKDFNVIRLPLAPVKNTTSTYSYTNTQIVNGVAFVPSFAMDAWQGHPDLPALRKSDAVAQQAYEKLGFKVVPIPCYALAERGGSVHCMVHQIPNGLPLEKLGLPKNG